MSIEEQLKEFLKQRTELSDPVRRGALFANFPLKEVKPDWYESKLHMWIVLISETSQKMNKVSFTMEELKSRFTVEGMRPECLHTVMEEMEKKKQVQKLKDFMAPEKGWGAWFVGLFVNSLFYFWPSNTNVEGTFVLMDMVKAKAESVESKFKKNKFMILEDLVEQTKDAFHSAQDLELAVQYLVKAKKACKFEMRTPTDEVLMGVKFAADPLNETETGILHMMITHKKLEKQKAELETKIESLVKQALLSSKQKHKEKAILLLKQKKRLQEILLQRMTCMDTLSQILEKIEDAHTNAEIMQAYQTGNQALKQTTEKLGLSREAVEKVMDDVFETLADHQEIEDAMSQPMSVPGIDESELEEELEKLMLEQPASVPATPIKQPVDEDTANLEAQLNALSIGNTSPFASPQKQREASTN